jgi:hypothetical protein
MFLARVSEAFGSEKVVEEEFNGKWGGRRRASHGFTQMGTNVHHEEHEGHEGRR